MIVSGSGSAIFLKGTCKYSTFNLYYWVHFEEKKKISKKNKLKISKKENLYFDVCFFYSIIIFIIIIIIQLSQMDLWYNLCLSFH